MTTLQNSKVSQNVEKQQFPGPHAMGSGGCGHLADFTSFENILNPKIHEQYLQKPGENKVWPKNSTCGHNIIQVQENRQTVPNRTEVQNYSTPGPLTKQQQDPFHRDWLTSKKSDRRGAGGKPVRRGLILSNLQMMITAETINRCLEWKAVNCTIFFLSSLILLVSSKGARRLAMKAGITNCFWKLFLLYLVCIIPILSPC